MGAGADKNIMHWCNLLCCTIQDQPVCNMHPCIMHLMIACCCLGAAMCCYRTVLVTEAPGMTSGAADLPFLLLCCQSTRNRRPAVSTEQHFKPALLCIFDNGIWADSLITEEHFSPAPLCICWGSGQAHDKKALRQRVSKFVITESLLQQIPDCVMFRVRRSSTWRSCMARWRSS